jgi:putative solute:sodium symporter small subunit
LTKILLLVVFVITLVVPFFNRTEPTLFGFPFFYWYQMAAVPVSSLLIYVVFRAEDREETEE